MVKLVNLPNGSQGSFPDEMPWEQIESVIQKQFPVEQPKDERNLLQKAGGAAQKYVNEPIEDIGRQALSMGAGAGQGLANTGAGVRNLMAKGANLLPGVNIPMAKSVDIAPNNINSLIGQFGGSMIGGGGVAKGLEKGMNHINAIPQIGHAISQVSKMLGKSSNSINKIMKVTKDIGKNAIAGAAVNPEDQGLGALFGGGGAAAGKVIGATAPAIGKKLGITDQPGSEVASYVDPEKYREKFEAAQRLGRTLTPGELTENPWIAGKEAAFKRTIKGSFENVEQGNKKVEQEKNAIKNFLDNVYDNKKSTNAEKNRLYKSVEKWNLKPSVMNKLKEDPLISQAIHEVSKDPAWQRNLKNVPENNVAYLDKVKRELGDMERGLKTQKGGGGKSLEYGQARKALTDVMDQAVPGYAKARELAQRKIIRRQIRNKLKKDEISGTELYKKILTNDIEYDELHNSVKNIPEAQQQLSDMKKSFKSLINLKTATAEAAQKENFWNSARSSVMQIYQSAKDLLGVSDSEKAIKYLNNREWFDDLVSAKTKKEKNEILGDIMNTILPAGLNVAEKGEKE